MKNNKKNIVLARIYSNVEADKAKILKENRVKSGIYMFTNLINGKKYIGSSIDLRNRFYQYYSIKYLESDNCMPICMALLKYGYHKFSLEILEYCKEKDTLIRERHYFYLLSPKYNISLDPTATFLGRTHSDETRKQMSDTHTGSKHSDETRQKMSETRKKMDNSGHFKTGHKKVEGSGRASQEIEVIDLEEKTTITYNSMGEAARALDLPRHNTISKYILRNQTKPYKDRYIFKKVN
jgi:group I intron endonuclease